MQYYLKARFQYNKNQFADLMMISGIGATLTQVCHSPSINHFVEFDCSLTYSTFSISLYFDGRLEMLHFNWSCNCNFVQLFLMPILVPAVGEEKLLTTGLFVSCISVSSNLTPDSYMNFLFESMLLIVYFNTIHALIEPYVMIFGSSKLKISIFDR